MSGDRRGGLCIETTVPSILALARGHRDVAAALADRSLEMFGDPALVDELPSGFLPAESAPDAPGATVLDPSPHGQVAPARAGR